MINKCTFIGNLGKDPDYKVLESGHKVASFSIACSRKVKKQGKWRDKGIYGMDSNCGLGQSGRNHQPAGPQRFAGICGRRVPHTKLRGRRNRRKTLRIRDMGS